MEKSQTMALGIYLRENIVRALRKMPTTISTSIWSSSPPSHKPTWKAFPLELSCTKVETRIKKWKVGKGKGKKEKGCDANLKIPFSPLPLPFCARDNFRAITPAERLLRRPVLMLRRDCPF